MRFALQAALAVALTCVAPVRCSLLLDEALGHVIGVCRVPERCSRRPHPPQHPADIAPELFTGYPCFCDTDCHAFKDCCHDLAENATLDTEDLIYGLPSSQWSCEKISSTPKGPYLWMVSSCPEQTDQVLAADCAAKAPDRTYLHDLPVIAAGLLYKNIFCATCHGATYTDLYPLSVGISCQGNDVTSEDLINATYVPGEAMFQLPGRKICKLDVQEFSSISGLNRNLSAMQNETLIRQCRKLTNVCGNGWPDQEISEKCSSYTMFVEGMLENRTPSVFRNPHCAICNNVSKMFCGNSRVRLQGRLNIGIAVPTGSLSLIFHFSFGGGNVVGREACSEGHVWDSIFQKCQKIFTCDNKYGSDLCAAEEPQLLEGENSLNCSSVVLEQHSFVLMENGSIFVNSSKTYVSAEDFVFLSEDRVQVCVEEEEEIPDSGGEISFSALQNFLTLICTIVSLIGLSLHILVLLAVPKLRNLPGMISMGISVSLLIAQLLFLIATSPSRPQDYGGCVALAAVLHFAFLSVFAWTAVMSFDIWRTFSHPTGHLPGRKSNAWKVQWARYCVAAVLGPLAVVAIAVGLDQSGLSLSVSPNYGMSTACWFGSRLGLAIFFALPVFLILIFNLTLYTLVVVRIKEQKKATEYIRDRKNSRKNRYSENDCKLHFSIFNIMGGTWILGIIAGVVDHPILWTVYIILSGSQGAIIFILQILKPRVIHMIRNRLTGREDTTTSNNSGSGKRTSSSLLNRNSERSSVKKSFLLEESVALKSRVE
ncbi:Hypothetical predicted protein [Cloeon dipterum]|uniref:G-protein coupled receptors family 2 profile 2 domain-containing protein n=3 Tax=Cloeon dipterum TaxID=197152 RepID=A0A8S1E700_9INSE|nr:Hypothetical predicted protein [Cloeon dipterum]